ncbi:MAG: 1-acyl-sn-glycerol-3-phosphate acyltransferase [Chloroflexi bacterium]|nr:1-acyl-sn-glycerol-3-phosphate acyltransferase [Chloroflexota bacterium]
MWTRHFCNSVLRILFKILLKVEIVGLENVPPEGPLILMITHTNFLDPVLAGGLMPREVVMMSKAENFWHPILGILVRLYGAFPVRRGEVDLRAIRRSLEVLANGEVLLMAPEGTRSGHGRLQKGHDGMTYIALRADAPILPMAIIGGERFWAHLPKLHRTPIKIIVGQVFRFSPELERVGRATMSKMTEEAMYQLASLLPPERWGFYSDLNSATEEHLVFPPGSSSNLPKGGNRWPEVG